MGNKNISNFLEVNLEKDVAKFDFSINNIKSKYILKQILDNLHKLKLLQIIRYNKNIQNKRDINLKDYKEYSKQYSSIEIDIIPINKEIKKIINIKDKKDQSYYHIYLNDSKEEIKDNISIKKDKIKKFVVKIDYQVKSLSELFFFL